MRKEVLSHISEGVEHNPSQGDAVQVIQGMEDKRKRTVDDEGCRNCLL